jgi:ABC-2 type transport system permease protein
VSGREIRYVDWLIPGLIGMNIMFSALYGVGYVIVRYRKNGVLKRLKATPLSAIEFLTAQVFSRLWLIMAVAMVVFFGTNFFVDFAMYGSYLTLFLVFAMGAFTMISMGLVIAARIASEEFAEGMLNMVSWPMMFLSGVWFSLEGTNTVVQQLAKVFPLTHMIDAARAVMFDGATLAGVAPELLILALMSAVFLSIGALLFRWE